MCAGAMLAILVGVFIGNVIPAEAAGGVPPETPRQGGIPGGDVSAGVSDICDEAEDHAPAACQPGSGIYENAFAPLPPAPAQTAHRGPRADIAKMASPHIPIVINSDLDFNSGNGVTGGSGTKSDPFIIDGWDINGNGYGNALYIGNTTQYFIVRNCLLHDAKGTVTPPYRLNSGIEFYKVKNGRLDGNVASKNWQYGITLYASSSNEIANNNVSNNFRYGIDLYQSTKNNISNNAVSMNTGCGIYLDSSSNSNVIDNNAVSDNTAAEIWLVSLSSDNVIMNNDLSDKYGSGINLAATSRDLLYNNNLLGVGIQFAGWSPSNWNTHVIATSNHVNNKPVYYYKNKTSGTVPTDAGQAILANCTKMTASGLTTNDATIGIQVGFCTNVTITNNHASQNNNYGIAFFSTSKSKLTYNTASENPGCGIKIQESESNRVESNTIVNNIAVDKGGSGLWMMGSDRNVVKGNTVGSNGDGIYLDGSSSNYFIGNSASGNGEGVKMEYSMSNHFLSNDIGGNSKDGFYMYYSDKNNISYNNINSNANYGVYAEAGNYNRIHHNNFAGNNKGGKQACDIVTWNFWNDSKKGNYWSDWTSPDANHDGIVDKPYVVYGSTGGQDYHPLTTPVPVPEFPSLVVLLVTASALLVAAGWDASKRDTKKKRR